MADSPLDTLTGISLTIDGAPVDDTLDFNGDHDWFAVDLVAGQTYTFQTASTAGVNDISNDTTLALRDGAGNLLAFNDDYDNPPGRFSKITFTATDSGTFFLDVGGYNDLSTGGYRLSAVTSAPPALPVYDNDQIADQLTDGFWNGDPHHWDVAPGGTITVNISRLSPAGQFLALNALALWTEATGILFQPVASVGLAQIRFTDTSSGAFTNSSWTNGLITSATVNISTAWISTYGTTLNSYSFQTFVHEIGHALGLGHGGNYNGTASYPADAHYANDAWPASVMSYFDAYNENTWFADQGFTNQLTLTPTAADIIAVNNLYGAHASANLGNTTYGFNSNSGNQVYDVSQNLGAMVTITDHGGTDTLDYSGTAASQQIYLVPEVFSNVVGRIGNLVIARGTVIENATGGSGSDILIGNDANNTLDGGAGNDEIDGGLGDDDLDGGTGTDTVRYSWAAAGVTVDLGLAGVQATGGGGNDVLANFENLYGSRHNDQLTGDGQDNLIVGLDGNDEIHGQAGNDFLTGGPGNDIIDGGDDDDRLDGGDGDDQLGGGNGDDTADYSFAAAAVTVSLGVATPQDTGGAGIDSLSNIENLTGSIHDDALSGNLGANVLDGGPGADSLTGRGGPDTLTGDAGNDTLQGGSGDDTLDGGADDDRLVGSAGNDTLEGGPGNDRLNGGADDDILNGGDGDDIIVSGFGADTMNGGADNDIYIVNDAGDVVIEDPGAGMDSVTATVDFTLPENVENLTLRGGARHGTGNALDNTISGFNGADILSGLEGADRLRGFNGADTLLGGDGEDLLEGGPGADSLTGGADRDTFLFRDGDLGHDRSHADMVQDFSQADQDKVRLKEVDADSVTPGVQGFSWIGDASFSGTTGELRYEFDNGKTYVEGDTDGDGLADFAIGFDALINFTAADFAL